MLCLQYVLLVATDPQQGRSKLLVRGDRQSGYHMDIFHKAVDELRPLHLHVSAAVLTYLAHETFQITCLSLSVTSRFTFVHFSFALTDSRLCTSPLLWWGPLSSASLGALSLCVDWRC